MKRKAAGRIARAEVIACIAHAGQTDKAGMPYVEHCSRVAGKLSDPRAKTVAWLHDVIEDGSIDETCLRGAFGARIVDAVVAITQREGEKRSPYYARVRANRLARQVKLADIHDNLEPARLALLKRREAARLVVKYGKALKAIA